MSYGYVYILRSTTTDRHYIGSAVDPDRRLNEHNSGHVTATRNKGPWERVACIRFPEATAARKAEYLLKRLRSRRIVNLVIDGSFEWPPDLQPASETDG